METILGVYCKDYPNMAYLHKEDLDTVDKVNDKVKQLGQLFLHRLVSILSRLIFLMRN